MNRSPSIALRPFGTTFQVTGTAATQYSRTAPRADAPPARDRRERADPEQHDGPRRRGPRARAPAALGASSTGLAHGVTTTVPPMSGPWIQQKYLYVPGVENVTRDALGNPIGAPAVSSVTKNPFPCIAFPEYV